MIHNSILLCSLNLAILLREHFDPSHLFVFTQEFFLNYLRRGRRENSSTSDLTAQHSP